jgi:shikimate dehydrogenase|tara:strand:+ start:4116 stop:4772 length:657 start_codon:yes stop_codon:yes gene_type:complete
MGSWIDKNTEIYCSFAKTAGNTGCQMMNTAFYYYGLNKIYKSFSVDNIEDAVNSVRALGIKGFAITMPYKIEVLEYVDDMDEATSEIGASNTVINDNGKLIAYNTDAYAARTFLKDYDNQKELYILGDGGYSKAVAWSAERNGFDIKKVTRKNWSDLQSIKSSIIYNCTPVDISNPMLKIDRSNNMINCLVETETGKHLAKLQASKQFYLYTGMKFPL